MLRYAITDGSVDAASLERGLARVARDACRWAAEGVDYALIREKTLPAGALAQVVRAAVAATRGSTLKVLVAGRADVALAAGAAGVHLSGSSQELTPAEVRQVAPGAFVTVSCHTLTEVAQARGDSADAVLFGPVFGKAVQGVEVVPGLGVAVLRAACALGVPVFALGGVDAKASTLCRQAGVVGVAGIRMFAGGGAETRARLRE